MRTVGSLPVMCDPRDLGVSITEAIAGSLTMFEPNLYLYDNYPGGIGQSAALFKLRRDCWKARHHWSLRALANRAARVVWVPWAKWASEGKRSPAGF